MYMYSELPQKKYDARVFCNDVNAAFSGKASSIQYCSKFSKDMLRHQRGALPVTMQIPRGPAASGFTVTEWSRSRRAEQG